MSSFFYPQTKTAATVPLTRPKVDDSPVLVEKPESKEPQVEGNQSTTPRGALGVVAALSNARSSGVKIARLPTFEANVTAKHRYRVTYAVSAVTGGNIAFNCHHISTPLVFATSTSVGRPLGVAGRLESIEMMWVDTSAGGAIVAGFEAPELQWAFPSGVPFSKRTVTVASPSTAAGGGYMKIRPPKGSFHSQWIPTEYGNSQFLVLDKVSLGAAYIRWLLIDFVIENQLCADDQSGNGGMTITAATSNRIMQIAPLGPGGSQPDAQGYWTAYY